jgi:hypothetical protein
MQIEVLKNGNLKMSADIADRKKIVQIIRVNGDGYAGEAQFITEMLKEYYQVKVEDVGALTDAPLIAQGSKRNMEVWGYLDYQVYSLLEELAVGNTVIWKKG